MERISWLVEELLASKEGLCSIEFVEIVGCWLVGWLASYLVSWFLS
jgi:hypothetical protein